MKPQNGKQEKTQQTLEIDIHVNLICTKSGISNSFQ